jgi:hypothetical protein
VKQIKKALDSLNLEMQTFFKEKQIHWGTRLFIPDSLIKSNLGVNIRNTGSASELKLAIVDLDHALSRRGERIGCLLIVGGGDIVPFHTLPNPVDDQDEEVLSDNPYGTRGDNYFTQDWLVGRLPDESGNDVKFLVKQIKQISTPAAGSQPTHWYQRWLTALRHPFNRPSAADKKVFGYSTEIWIQASKAVYQSLGEGKNLYSSPPHGLNPADFSGKKRSKGKALREIPAPSGRIGYFNLHGLIDTPEWYGQRSAADKKYTHDYPVALSPRDVDRVIQNDSAADRSQNTTRVPQVVFSESCFGAHIIKKSIDQALALKFLDAGASVFVGSTCMSYGSLSQPLIAADYLAQRFFIHLQNGVMAGEAYQWAKNDLIKEMIKIQGYLDGEDQKTLISFVFYGNPFTVVNSNPKKVKGINRSLKPEMNIQTVCDRGTASNQTGSLSMETLSDIKQYVAKHLPVMNDADLSYATENILCDAHGHCCPTSQIGNKTLPENPPSRRLVTLKKRVDGTDQRFNLVARLRLDTVGRVVKVAISR